MGIKDLLRESPMPTDALKNNFARCAWLALGSRLVKRHQRALPNLFIIGAQKAGSTWLYHLLDAHDAVKMSRSKEPRFFNYYSKLASPRAWQRYVKLFEDGKVSGAKYSGEATPGYLWVEGSHGLELRMPSKYNVNTPKTLKQVAGSNIKILVSLRNPVDRAISHFFHHFKVGRINAKTTIFECSKRHPETLQMGFYSNHVSAWKKHFSDSALRVLCYEDIAVRPQEVATSVFEFLDLPMVTNYDFNAIKNPGFSLRRTEGGVTINVESFEKANKLISAGALTTPEIEELTPSSLQRDVTHLRHLGSDDVPIITDDDVNELYAMYSKDIEFVSDLLGRPLDEWKQVNI